ncbi:MAG TPA: hypothetical protein VGR21_00445 [Cryptosporangiaceae bacterium]|nr:hypothetical protein [Cryptosporangiaceae bacterium]
MRRLVGFARRALPPGTASVGLGLGVLGVTGYVVLGLASHALDAVDYSAFSVLWTIVFAVGPGLFFPLEQELSRAVSARTERGEAPGRVVAKVGALAVGFLAVLLVVLAVTWDFVTAELFGGDSAVTLALALNVGALALAHLSRGVLAGTGRFGRYGAQLGVDGLLRSVLVVSLVFAGAQSPATLGVAIAAAQVAAVLVTSLPATRLGAGPPVRWSVVSAGLGLLLAATLFAQVLVNVGPAIAQLLSPNPALAGELLSASVLARIPVFVYASLQASLLPSLSRAVAAGDTERFRGFLRRGLGAVAVLGLVGVAGCALLGPWLVGVLFDGIGLVGRTDLAMLAAGTAVYLVAMVLGQALVALGRTGSQALAWTVGFVVLAMVTALPLDVLLRVELGYLLGSAAVAVVAGVSLTRHRADRPAAVPAPAAVLPGVIE